MVCVLYRSFAGIMFPGNVISQSLPINYLTCHFTSYVSSARPVTDDVFMAVCHWKRKKNISISFPICSLFLLVWIARQIDSAWYQFSGSFSNHHWHTHMHKIYTLRWIRMSARHSTATLERLGWNERYSSSSITPHLLPPQEWNLHCLPGTHSTLSPLCCFACKFPLARATCDLCRVPCREKKEFIMSSQPQKTQSATFGCFHAGSSPGSDSETSASHCGRGLLQLAPVQ